MDNTQSSTLPSLSISRLTTTVKGTGQSVQLLTPRAIPSNVCGCRTGWGGGSPFFFGFFAVSRGLTRKVEFACDEINDAGKVSVRAIASSFGFGGLNETVNSFEDPVADLGGEPA